MYGETADEPICSYVSSLPLQDVFAEVDAHLMWRQRREQQLQQLEQRASQFRAIQRRLLTKQLPHQAVDARHHGQPGGNLTTTEPTIASKPTTLDPMRCSAVSLLFSFDCQGHASRN